MIKGIVFDFGNVLCSFTNEILLERISAKTGKSKATLFDLIYKKSGLPKLYESGSMSSKEFYEKLSTLCGLHVSIGELKELYSQDKFTRIEGMQEVVSTLQNHYKVALLSNTSEWDFAYMTQVAPEIQSFDAISLSYKVGEMKPGTKLFEDVTKKLKLKPEECVYTDDIPEYVAIAQSLKYNGVLFTSKQTFQQSLENLGVLELRK